MNGWTILTRLQALSAEWNDDEHESKFIMRGYIRERWPLLAALLDALEADDET